MTETNAIHIGDTPKGVSILRWVISYFICVVVITILSVVISSIFVGLNLPVPVSAAGYIDLIGKDLIGLGPVFAVVTAIGAIIAFLCAEWVARKTGWARPFVFAVAGLVLMIVLLYALKLRGSGVQPIGRAEFWPNYLSLLGIGVLGGALFGTMTRKH
ncbi:hypothetical protein [Robiginitomaculum antarcticum]|uniref:hypothetical protein n=1 Tax=Robiginitomaculum antarcticum TaxID=437507 RepID=UPI000373F77B|nr:hypothetical protein [Robiginitomaculum antarcticum]